MTDTPNRSTATAADKMMKVMEAESAAGHKPPFTA